MVDFEPSNQNIGPDGEVTYGGKKVPADETGDVIDVTLPPEVLDAVAQRLLGSLQQQPSEKATPGQWKRSIEGVQKASEGKSKK